MNKGRNLFRVGVDIGGTFTSIVFVDSDGTMLTKKIPTTPSDLIKGIVNGLQEVLSSNKLSNESITQIVHGTTFIIDAIVEKRGSKAGLITTRGFRDTLGMGRGRIPIAYDLSWKKPTPPIPRYLVAEVNERIDGKGQIIRPLDIRQAVAAIDKLVSCGVESIAVCLLNSPHNPIHEQKIGQLLRETAPKVHVSLSTEVIPMIKEAERSLEVAINAYVVPVMTSYVKSLSDGLASIGVKKQVYMMQSCGGMTTLEASADRPIAIIRGGPAAGVAGGRYLASKLGIADVITFDMGGTSAKGSIIVNGEFTMSTGYEVGAATYRPNRLRTGSGYTLRTPAIDVFDLWCSSSSVIWHAGGMLHVGPQSAGAVPGPACYDRGGETPTLADAYVVLGYFNPAYLLEGDFKLNSQKSYQAIEDKVARPLGMETVEAAYGAYEIVKSNVSRIIAAVCAEKGVDPSKFVLLAFGGAGAIHAAEVGRALGMNRIIIPPNPGVFSAFGLLCADIERHFIRPFKRTFDRLAIKDMKHVFQTTVREAESSVGRWGYAGAKITVDRYANLRYYGQTAEVTLAIPEELSPRQLSLLVQEFVEQHQKSYGFSLPRTPPEVVSLRIVARISSQRPTTPKRIATVSKLSQRQLRSQRKAYFGKQYGLVNVVVLRPEQLEQSPSTGPLIIESYDSTIIVPPGCNVATDQWGDIVMNIMS